MAYSFYASITVDNTKVSGSSNLTNFPILVSGTYDGTGGEPDIRTTANSGNVQNTASGGVSGSYTVPADLVFSPNTDGSSPHDFEITKYNASTGEINAWVEISTLDYDDDTALYMVYGDSGVSTSQEDVNGTWGTFESSYHFEADGKDSAGNWDMTDVNSPSYTTGQVGNGVDINGSNSCLQNSTTNSLKPSDGSAVYLESWVDLDTTSSNRSLLASGYGSGSFTFEYAFVSGKFASNTRNDAWIQSTNAVSANTWTHVSLSFDGSTAVDFTKDSATNGSQSENSISSSGTHAGSSIGQNNADQSYLDGTIDELRIAYSDLGTDWGITSYNNSSSPSTFYSVGSETSAVAGVTPQMALTGAGT